MKLINFFKNRNETGIYCIRNSKNNKIYIGSTKTSFTIRKNKHLRLLRKNIHYNEHLQNAWNYYNENSFSFEILFICSPDECEKYEGEFIKLYSSNVREHGYNIASVTSYQFNYSMSELHNKEKCNRKKNKAKKISGLESEERGLPKPFKIYDLNGKFIIEYGSAKEYSEINDVKARGVLSIILKNRKLLYRNLIVLFSNDILSNDDIISANKKAIKKIELYDLNNNLIKIFNSANDCADFIGCKSAEIRMCCLGKRNRIKQYKTKYKTYG